MIKNKMNKLGGSKILSIWWLFILAIIGGGIVIGVVIYYSYDVNIDKIHSDVLAERVIDCIIEDGYLVEGLGDDFDVFEKCNLRKEVFESESVFYFKILVSGENLKEEFGFGNLLFEEDCIIGKEISAKYFPKCSLKREVAIYNGKNVNVIVLTGSNQHNI